MKLVFILAILALLKVTLLYRVYHRLPLRELKRRARAHETQAAALYKVAANDKPLDILLYLAGFVTGAFLIIAAAQNSWWLAALVVILIVWLLLWAPQPKIGGLLWRFSAWTSPYTFKVLNWLMPPLNLIANLLPAKAVPHMHTGLYEREDLLELINAQNRQLDNRIPEEDLKIAFGALSFGDTKVARVMTPRRKIKFVSEDEVVGPMLMDELHKAGFSRFPVVKGSAKVASPEVVGMLYFKDIVEIGQENKGKIKDHTRRGAFFINEDCNLRQAMNAILSANHHQLIVVNKFEEMVGVITLEDILEQIIGRPIVDEFDKYDDLRAVAQMEAEHDKKTHKEVAESKPIEEADNKTSDETVALNTQ